MKKFSKTLFVMLLISITIFTAVSCSDKNNDSGLNLPENDPENNEVTNNNKVVAPDFRITDIDGKEVRLSDFKGKPVVLNFWATYCPPCKRELPDFEAAYKKYGDKVQFLIVTVSDSSSEVKKFVKLNGYTMPMYIDAFGEASLKYKISGIPNTYFIDKDGNIATYILQMISAAQLESGIQKILK